MSIPKPRSAALMKSTLWSIDLACCLIDAVFKNSLVWGMGELQGGRRSCWAHLSMFTELGAFSQQQEKRPDGGHPGPNESQCHSVPDVHTNTSKHSSPRWGKKTNILHVLTYTCVVIIDCLVWSTSSFSMGLLQASWPCACYNKTSRSAQIFHLNRCNIHTLHLEAVVVQLSPSVLGHKSAVGGFFC